MIDNTGTPFNAVSGEQHLGIIPAMANRHGLIAGATGTGKTCTLQNMAETFSAMGIPVFATDIKGDLSGVGKAGGGNVHFEKSIADNKLADFGFAYKAYPVCLWDVFGEQGHPLRTTVSEMGPMLLSRILDLNDTQSDVLNMVFRIAYDQQLLLIDLKDLRKMLEEVGNNRANYITAYGNISVATVGAIQRSRLSLEDQGGNQFFGEPAIDIYDFMQTRQGKGVINILASDKIINSPKVYTSFLLYLLSELYEQLPEVGDLDKPKLVFFFDEAHMLFNNINKSLLEKIEQMVRLIRSKGVGIYFCTQNPDDIPDTILSQLGNRVQHALRAYTPRDQKAVRTAAETFRANPAFDTAKVITELGVGEALVSFLDAKGIPTMVERARVLPPEGQAGALPIEERQQIIRTSMVYGKYDTQVDRLSAYEILTERLTKQQEEKALAQQQKEEERLQKEEAKKQREEERLLAAEERKRKAEERERQRAKDKSLGGSLQKMVVTKAKRELVNEAFKLGRGLLGSLLKGK
jgi:DNA helicase HerA-like ATPase